MPLNLHNVPSKRRGKSACSLCRKKRVKCDRNAPCSTCVKYKNPRCGLMSNESSPNKNLQLLKPKTSNLDLENKKRYPGIKLISPNERDITNEYSKVQAKVDISPDILSNIPYDLPLETINIFGGSKIVGSNGYNRQYFGPLSWFTLLFHDEYTLPYVRYIEAHKKDFKTINEDLDTYTKEGHTFQDSHSRIKGEASLIQRHIDTKKNITRFPTFADEIQDDNLIERINTILPQKKVIWKYIDIFFSKIYPFFPLVDELDYRKHLEGIIGKRDQSDENLMGVKIRNTIDLAIIGLLLIFLRLVYLGLTSRFGHPANLDGSADSEKECLVSNVVGINAFKVAQRCFNQFNYSQCNNIQVLQLALYIRVYHTYAPEEGDGLDNRLSRTLNSVIIQMAYSLGLNRDPSLLFYKFNNGRLNNLSRKIWHFVMCLDYNNSIIFGDPLTTSVIPCDMKIPYYSLGCENCINGSLEKQIIQIFTKAKTRLEILKKVFDVLFNMEEEVNMNQLLESLAHLESYLKEESIILTNLLNSADLLSLEYMIEVNSWLDIRFLISSIYFKVYIHYEKKKNNELVGFYAKKLLKLSVIELYPFYLTILQGTAKKMDEFGLFYIIPSLIRLSQKLIFCLSFVLIRVKYFEFKMSIRESTILENDSHYLKAQTLISLLQECTKWILGCLKKLSLKYYIAWRLYKVHSHTLSVMLSDNFYSESRGLILNLWDPFSEEDINEIIEILRPFCNEIRSYNDSSDSQIISELEEYKDQSPFTKSETTPTVASTDFDDFWLNMMSLKYDIMNPNYDNYFDMFDPFTNTALGSDPVFDYDSNLNGLL